MFIISTSFTAVLEVGSNVRVKGSVTDPSYGWGGVTYQSIGVIKQNNGESVVINFPEFGNWSGLVSEIELA